MKRFHIYAIIALATLAGCQKDNGSCFISKGEVVTESRPIGTVRNIVVHDNVDLILTHDPDNQSLRVEAAENLIKFVETSVDGNKLTIRNNTKCNWLRDFNTPFRVYLSLQRLDSLSYRSSGNVSCTNILPNDSIQVDIWEGAGSVRMKIAVDKSTFYIHEGTVDLFVEGSSWVNFLSSRASGPADLSSLRTQYTFMYSSSPNNCYVNAEQHLSVTIDNIGDVMYTGDPVINVVMNSKGRLIKME